MALITYKIDEKNELVCYTGPKRITRSGLFADAGRAARFSFDNHNESMTFEVEEDNPDWIWSWEFVREAVAARDELVKTRRIDDEWEDGETPDEVQRVQLEKKRGSMNVKADVVYKIDRRAGGVYYTLIQDGRTVFRSSLFRYNHHNEVSTYTMDGWRSWMFSPEFVRAAFVARDQLIEEGLLDDKWETEDGLPPRELSEMMS